MTYERSFLAAACLVASYSALASRHDEGFIFQLATTRILINAIVSCGTMIGALYDFCAQKEFFLIEVLVMILVLVFWWCCLRWLSMSQQRRAVQHKDIALRIASHRIEELRVFDCAAAKQPILRFSHELSLALATTSEL